MRCSCKDVSKKPEREGKRVRSFVPFGLAEPTG